MNPGLTVGIATRNRPDALRVCLQSLDVLGALSPEVLVYDDASQPPAEETNGTIRPGVRFVRGSSGAAAGRNYIVHSASHEFVLLLDDDTVLFDSSAVTEALTTLHTDPTIAAVAFAQANRDGSPWPASMQPSPVTEPSVIAAFIGFAHLVRRSAFLEVGGYRDLFEYFGEEKEFCLRLIEAGKRTVYLPQALIAHVTDPAARDPRRYLRLVSRNDCLMSLYDDPFPRMLWMVPARLALYFRMRRGWKIHDPGGAWWVVKQLVRHLPRVWRDRRPVSRATLQRWRALRDRPEPYHKPVPVA